ncbi:hypothetical protein QYF52_09780 [Paenibacillus polymyxa]|uniref:hypothetical protein n=1 Tax=Paenibacillus polymyxa TaxID=1406 RepID=UPI0025B650E3|nr:hypothetical protein [Paenibacillus polymyxa]MDN4078224.1 hypothetical protein [Paenibacillus polymyxa]MDN4103645.1 hypothetical protein [Paenibacillus polymyxa]MDN4113722.1 hypothetical protein [Paenibacillus polymyxa]
MIIITKFEIGDETDQNIVKVIVHEYFRCTVAFESFVQYIPKNNTEFLNPDSKTNLLRYNAYSLFIQHLYEYFVGCVKRGYHNTRNIPGEKIDVLLNGEVEKNLRGWRIVIDSGTAPSWAKDRSYFEDQCPPEFGKNFRHIRNSLSHADFRRIEGGDRITLTDFFNKYHKYVMLLYRNGKEFWTIDDLNEIDLGDVTAFSRQTFQRS